MVLQAALARLDAAECLAVLEVISRLMSTQTYRREEGEEGAEGDDGMPLASVVAWSSALIDARFAELSMLPDARALFARLSSSVRMHVKYYQRLGPLRGSIAHIGKRAQLPPRRGTVSKVYSVELLRLG